MAADRTYREAIALWLMRAEREVREAFAAVQRDWTNESRARYARAREDLDAAFAASTAALAVPDDDRSAAHALFRRPAGETV